MKRRLAAISLVLLLMASLPALSSAQQQDEPESTRKVVNRVIPAYPQMAHNLNLRGSVRVEALIKPNGTVKSIQVIGGHPVLVDAAEDALRHWRWEPAARETRQTVEFKFDPK